MAVIKPINILLADEELDNQELLTVNLKEYNFLLPSSSDVIQKKPFISSSLAIVDYGFANNQGLEILKQLKTANHSLPVIFTASHFIKAELYVTAFKLGARDCFKKPLAVQDISESIELILKKRGKVVRARKDVLLDRYANRFSSDIGTQDVQSMERVKDFIENNYNLPLPLSKLSREACMSKYHFCRTFKKQVGMSSTEYINMVRIQEAKRLMSSNQHTISQICFMTGFNDLTYFERVFKKYEFCTPSTYRKNHVL